MSKFLKATESIPELAERGVEVRYIVDAENSFRLTIRPGGAANEAMQKAWNDAMRPYTSNNITPDKLPINVQREIGAKLTVEHVLLDWNAQDFGEPFSKEAALKILSHPDGADLGNWIARQSNDGAELRRLWRAQNAGN